MGNGVIGYSTNNNGVLGWTAAPSGGTVQAGVMGQDLSAGGVQAGVIGTSSNMGVLGKTDVGTGVYGSATGVGTAIYGTSALGVGVLGSTNAAATDFEYGVKGTAFNGGTAYLGLATGEGAQVTGRGSSASHPALLIQNNASATADMIRAYNQTPTSCLCATMKLTTDGNLYLTGTVHPSQATISSTSRGPQGTRVGMYMSEHAAPTVEDTADGQLTNGQGIVRIDPVFASTMDPSAGYRVLITPEGDNRGLYVTQKTPTTFVVRESQGGRSTLAFSYRIVGRPAGTTEQRLPMVAIERLPQNQRSFAAQRTGRDAREASRAINAGFVPKAPQFTIPKHPRILPH